MNDGGQADASAQKGVIVRHGNVILKSEINGVGKRN
jgi:hypothetical protein